MAGKQSFAFIGISNFALSMISSLVEKRQSVKVFDFDEHKMNLYLSEFSTVDSAVINSTNKKALKKEGIQSYDAVIVSIGDVEDSLATVLNLIDLECKKIIVRARDENQKRILLALGLSENQIIIPDKVAGKIAATRILFNIDFDLDVQTIDNEFVSSTLEVSNPDIFDKTIQEIGLSANKDFNIIQIKHKGKIILPDDYTELREGDLLLVFAKNTIINMLAKKVQGKDDEDTV
ncbi:TrkA family potassium uptake protein [Vibrio harveyi]|nr:TrkA family potassium uptake protein [Vibrio harveyi]